MEGFGAFGAFAGWQTAALKANRKPLLWPWPWGACSGSGLGPGVPAGDGVWRVWRVLEGLEGLEGFGRFGAFAGWQTVALKAHRKFLAMLWPWLWVPVGEVALALGCLLGRVLGGFGRFWKVLEGVWRVWRVLEGLEGLESFGGFGAFAGWQTAALKAHSCGLGPGVPVREVALALECLLGRVFGGFGGFWRVWRVWRVWSVCGLANGSFESP